ncbi:ASCH domain-containing protein [Leptolyngbya sp. GB1-A1]|uniref:ASCH domain-containing protein n=1 Tax=Leptolyngbya sp. GB1-A1 TaxID=2933908 RepID=UPI00329936E8
MQEKRIQFVSDNLADQIVQGRKTASCVWLDQLGDEDDYNHALTVGEYYTVYKLDKTPACKIRILCLELCTWNNIPERLWRGETNMSAEEFRSDHVEYFNHPPDEFEFVAYYFELVEPNQVV